MPKTNVFIPNLSSSAVPLDNQQFNVKFNQTVAQLESGLTKSQRALGLFYNENQQLNDALGRCVEGLSLWQLKLGMWIDETGKARTVAGGYAEGLSRTELELGYYVNKLGEVQDRNQKFIRKTKEAIAAENEQAEALQRSREAFADAFDAMGDGAGRMGALLGQFEGLKGGTEEARLGLIKYLGALDAASQTFSSVQNLGAWFNEAKKIRRRFKYGY